MAKVKKEVFVCDFCAGLIGFEWGDDALGVVFTGAVAESIGGSVLRDTYVCLNCADNVTLREAMRVHHI